MAGTLGAFDPAEGLTSDEAVAGFMEEAFKTEDVGYIAHALGVVARATGMTQIANETACRANSSIGHSARPAIRP